jgi:hypothetical protein
MDKQILLTVRAALHSNFRSYTIIENGHTDKTIGIDMFVFWDFPDKKDFG